MSRTCSLIILVLLAVGCTRYGTNPQGKPFTRKPYTDPGALIPPGPPATSSPLVLATPVPPEGSHPPEPVALANGYVGPKSEVIPAGGVPVDAATFPPRRLPKRVEPLPGKLPSPFAPKNPGVDTPGSPALPKNPGVDTPGSLDPARHIAEVKKLAEAAAAKWARVDTYECVVTRRELAPNKKMNEDVVLYRFRKEPMAVYLRNLDEANQPREIIYTRSEDKIHAIIGKGDATVLFKVGAKAPVVSPDFPMVKDKTRYSIREAGYGTPIARVAGWVAKAEAGKIPAEALTYLGEVNRKEYPYPLLGVQLKLRPGDEPNMPNGGTRQWFFDPKPDSPSQSWPVLIIATEPNGKEVEYYLFEKMKLQVPLTDADFDPARFNKKK